MAQPEESTVLSPPPQSSVPQYSSLPEAQCSNLPEAQYSCLPEVDEHSTLELYAQHQKAEHAAHGIDQEPVPAQENKNRWWKRHWILLLILIVVVVGAAIGGGVGGTLTAEKKNSALLAMAITPTFSQSEITIAQTCMLTTSIKLLQNHPRYHHRSSLQLCL
jgi:hypothetical protein